jgi:hypothetical protein
VTQVVENHVRSLSDSDAIDKIALVSSSRVGGISVDTQKHVTQVVVKDFDYDPISPVASVDNRQILNDRASAIAEDVTKQLAAIGLSCQDTVLHWHNHSLGKNTAAPAVVARLASDGWRTLLQIHDFAEDNRPQNYRGLIGATGATSCQELDEYLYPVASQIHYATLTQSDADVLKRLGVPDRQTHCLPNSVVAASEQPPSQQASLRKVCDAFGLPSDAKWSLYPVRGIRRKNVGEFLMLCRWMPETMYGGLTLCPTTPVEERSYERWRQVGRAYSPRAVFDAAHQPQISFAENLAACDYVVSSSVAEGFGMAFMEPWLSNRGVIARRLPTVTSDFESLGVQLPQLYDEIPVVGKPDWIREQYRELITSTEQAWAPVPEAFRPDFSSVDADTDSIDFAKLTPKRQMEVLERLSSDPGYETELRARSTDLVGWLNSSVEAELVDSNRDTIRGEFSPKRLGRQLESIYVQLASTSLDKETRGPGHSGSAIDLINSIRPFYPCRTEVIHD